MLRTSTWVGGFSPPISFSPAVLASVEVLTAGAHGEDAAATTALSALLAFGIPLCGLVAVLRRVPALATVVRGGWCWVSCCFVRPCSHVIVMCPPPPPPTFPCPTPSISPSHPPLQTVLDGECAVRWILRGGHAGSGTCLPAHGGEEDGKLNNSLAPNGRTPSSPLPVLCFVPLSPIRDAHVMPRARFALRAAGPAQRKAGPWTAPLLPMGQLPRMGTACTLRWPYAALRCCTACT